jgi:hypothetical protein
MESEREREIIREREVICFCGSYVASTLQEREKKRERKRQNSEKEGEKRARERKRERERGRNKSNAFERKAIRSHLPKIAPKLRQKQIVQMFMLPPILLVLLNVSEQPNGIFGGL